ncbi:Fatty acid desaturase [Sulfitobacter brevis]|uniref:Fatty acid desaturase n=1 Tax=Sulfitobacter brevis TaxID=74348 RepID=A0A1I1SNE9_9RHOB|nr:fatty acid desaturase [Sulfitobacter brevis]SFD47977.1 Fatty acid desaturase [Sulfitobacter brevis]
MSGTELRRRTLFPVSIVRLWGTVIRWDWPTLALFIGCAALWGKMLMLPTQWGVVSFLGLVVALTLHSSLSHEMLHGHPFRSDRAATLLGLIQPGLFVPYLRFRTTHLAHHDDPKLTDPYEDPETNYIDPAVWARLPNWLCSLMSFNNTLLGRMVVGPALGMVGFWAADAKRMRQGDGRVAREWALHLPGAVLVLWLVSLSNMPLWLYVLACYGALSVLKIRTFLEHQAHERAVARTVIIEDRGPLALLFLNNNLHVVHHMHPGVSWYRLPALYRAHKARYLRRNKGYFYPSYAEVFRQFLWRRKDPVAHPLWRPKPE